MRPGRPPKVAGPKKAAKPRPLPDPLTRDQAAAIIAVPNIRCDRGLRYRAILETLYRAGLRISEVLALQPEDVRFGEQMLRVRNSKRGTHRNVPMGPILQTYLEAWDACRPESEWFFAASSGKKMMQKTVWNAIKGYVVKAAAEHPELGFDRRGPVSAHTFRHTFATELVEEGVDIRYVQNLLGHASIANTMIYVKVRPQMLRDIMQRRDLDRSAGGGGA